ncbi:hypothetical protein TCON_1470 [Astathelohania contejeani]|uniref:GLTSCR protein conserved domain-containing protein n=1 Tax=Astathelohania contejeani TaxID=164912 RepID=A0ABQ7HYS4_9MICR|nr:hypothetical protein TCON_1470 [Thelohania contejeani]
MEGQKKINDIIIDKPTNINSELDNPNALTNESKYNPNFEPRSNQANHLNMDPRAMFEERLRYNNNNLFSSNVRNEKINNPNSPGFPMNTGHVNHPYSRISSIRTSNSISNIIHRRERILRFLHKDQYQIIHPDLRPFANTKHAYECLIPYHIFSKPAYEDLLYLNTSDREGLNEDIIALMERVDKELKYFEENQKIEQNVVLDILGVREAKYVFDRLNDHLNNKNDKDQSNQAEAESNKQMESERPKKRKYVRKSSTKREDESSEIDIAEQAIIRLKLLRKPGDEIIKSDEKDAKIILKFNKSQKTEVSEDKKSSDVIN